MTVKVAALVPKSTAVAPAKSVPVMVTEVPPGSSPAVGLSRGDSRRGHIGERIGRGGGRRPTRSGHGDVDRAGASSG